MERGGQYVDSDEEDGYESPDAKRRGASVDDFLKGSELGKPVSGTQASRGPEAPGRDKDGTMPGPGRQSQSGKCSLNSGRCVCYLVWGQFQKCSLGFKGGFPGDPVTRPRPLPRSTVSTWRQRPAGHGASPASRSQPRPGLAVCQHVVSFRLLNAGEGHRHPLPHTPLYCTT